jgi:hypothetical protein
MYMAKFAVFFAQRVMLYLKLLYLILSLTMFCFIMKNSAPPCTPSGQS